MINLLLHPVTQKQLGAVADRPSHAVMLVGPTGSGKSAAARLLAAKLLAIDPVSLIHYPYFLHVVPDGASITIDVIRQLQHFLSRKIPSSRSLARIVLLENAHLLTREAQNALLKTLEEPPSNTLLLLTAAQEQSLLPTIRSRVQTVVIKRPNGAEQQKHFIQAGYSEQAVEQAYYISGGLPGLMQALLSKKTGHPLVQASASARNILQATRYERLLLVDDLSQQRQLLNDSLFILQRMARHGLAVNPNARGGRWQIVLRTAYEAQAALLDNAQPKLVLTNLMLSL